MATLTFSMRTPTLLMMQLMPTTPVECSIQARASFARLSCSTRFGDLFLQVRAFASSLRDSIYLPLSMPNSVLATFLRHPNMHLGLRHLTLV